MECGAVRISENEIHFHGTVQLWVVCWNNPESGSIWPIFISSHGVALSHTVSFVWAVAFPSVVLCTSVNLLHAQGFLLQEYCSTKTLLFSIRIPLTILILMELKILLWYRHNYRRHTFLFFDAIKYKWKKTFTVYWCPTAAVFLQYYFPLCSGTLNRKHILFTMAIHHFHSLFLHN